MSQAIFEADSREEVIGALDDYLDAIKTLPRCVIISNLMNPNTSHLRGRVWDKRLILKNTYIKYMYIYIFSYIY